MHCQIPPKYNIYLVGLPSVLYETTGHIKKSVLNQVFLLLFSEKCMKSVKSTYERPFARNCNPMVCIFTLTCA